jgi:ABC-type Na+ efflux pump permease subunit
LATAEATKLRIAKFISFTGHPLLTIPLFVCIVMFATESFGKALFISVLIIGGIFVPSIVSMYAKSKNGTYTNFDFSDQRQ